jgi:positive regulator of sigma E activity
MNITVDPGIVTIMGNIKSVSDYQTIKAEIDKSVTAGSALTLKIPESISITSSVIGYFNKLVQKDKVNLNMQIGNEQLMELLDELNLKALFNAKRV